MAQCVVAFFGYKSIQSLSGHDTVLDVAAKFVANIKLNQWACYLVAALTSGWAIGERKLRNKKVRALHRRNKQLEKIIESKRESSSLTSQGTTRQEDYE